MSNNLNVSITPKSCAPARTIRSMVPSLNGGIGQPFYYKPCLIKDKGNLAVSPFPGPEGLYMVVKWDPYSGKLRSETHIKDEVHCVYLPNGKIYALPSDHIIEPMKVEINASFI